MSYKPYYAGGWQSGESGGTPLTPEALQHFDEGIKSAHRAGQPKNLLDNSDFRNPVNQRGLTSYTGVIGTMYTIDRWKRTNFDCTVAIVSGENGKGIKFASTSDNLPEFQQLLEPGTIVPGKTYTLACELLDGSIHVCKGEAEAGRFCVYPINEEKTKSIGFGALVEGGFDMVILAHHSMNVTEIKWMALYEGEYTAETLPEYQTKGYAAELAECRRYYCRLDTADGGVYGVVLPGMITSGNKDIILTLPITTMRIARPTATISGGVILRGISGYIENSDSGISVSLATLSNGVGHNIRVNKTDGTVFSVNAVNNTPVTLSLSAGSYMELSADL